MLKSGMCGAIPPLPNASSWRGAWLSRDSCTFTSTVLCDVCELVTFMGWFVNYLIMSHQLTGWMHGTVLEKLIIVQLVKIYAAFYGTKRFVTVFTSAHQWSLSWCRCIHSTPSNPISVRAILILSSHLHLGLLHSLFLPGLLSRILYIFLISPIHATCLPIS